jgi:hypothetical protein
VYREHDRSAKDLTAKRKVQTQGASKTASSMRVESASHSSVTEPSSLPTDGSVSALRSAFSVDTALLPAAPFSDTAQAQLTPARVDKILTAYGAGFTLRLACAAAGVHPVDFRIYRARHKELEARWAEAEKLHTQYLEERAVELAHAATSTTPLALHLVLRARKPELYRDNVKLEHSGSVDFASSFAGAMANLARSSETVKH